MKNFYITAAFILLSALSLPSLGQSKALELSYEAAANNIRMPSSETGELTMQVCAKCKVLRLRATETTRYELGGQQVTLAQMTEFLSRNPEADLVVLQRNHTTELSRLVVPDTKRAK
jgi:hypothetical protein